MILSLPLSQENKGRISSAKTTRPQALIGGSKPRRGQARSVDSRPDGEHETMKEIKDGSFGAIIGTGSIRRGSELCMTGDVGVFTCVKNGLEASLEKNFRDFTSCLTLAACERSGDGQRQVLRSASDRDLAGK